MSRALPWEHPRVFIAPGPTRILKLQFPPEPEYAAQFADTIVEAARELQKIELDYTPRSITKLEAIMCGLRDEGAVVDDISETLFSFGCYLGEVIVNAIGGEWYEHAPGRLALWTGEGDIDDRQNDDDILDPILHTFEFFQAPDTQGLAAYVATIIGEPIESGVTAPPPVDVPPELLRAIGMRLGTALLAMQENGIAALEPVLLRMRGGEVIDDAWTDDERDPDSWRFAREAGVARAMISGPGSTSAGFISMIATIDPGSGQCVHCAVPTLPAGRGQPFTIYALQADAALPEAARAEILGGIELIDPSLVANEQPPRAVLRVEYLGPHVTREEGYLYAVTGKGVYRTRRRAPGDPPAMKETVLNHRIELDPTWLYFVDKDGAVARVPMFQGGLCERYVGATDTERAEMRAPVELARGGSR